MFNTNIEAGTLDFKTKKWTDGVSAKDNRLYIDPDYKGKIKVIYRYLDKKCKNTIKVSN